MPWGTTFDYGNGNDNNRHGWLEIFESGSGFSSLVSVFECDYNEPNSIFPSLSLFCRRRALPSLTVCFHFIHCTNSSCTKCGSLPRFLISLGSSFWYLKHRKIPRLGFFVFNGGHICHHERKCVRFYFCLLLTNRPNGPARPASCTSSPPSASALAGISPARTQTVCRCRS